MTKTPGTNPHRRPGQTFHDNHLCIRCGARFSDHGAPGNPHAADTACPPGKFPDWPSSIADQNRAGEVFDQRVKAFWLASSSTFRGEL